MTKKFTDFATLTSADSNDIVAGFDVSANVEKKIPVSGLPAGFTDQSIGISKLNAGTIPGVLMSNDTGVVGQPTDTAWTAAPLGPNYNSGTLRYRRIAGVTYVNGQANRATGSPTSTDIVCTLPAGFRTDQNFVFYGLGSTTNGGKCEVRTDGTVQVVSTFAGGSYINFGISYPS